MYYSKGLPFIQLPPDKEQPYEHSALQTKGLQKMEVTLKAQGHLWTAERRVIYDGPGFHMSQQIPASPSSIYADNPPKTLQQFQEWWDMSRALRITFFGGWFRAGDNQVSAINEDGNSINSKSIAMQLLAPNKDTQQVNLILQNGRITGEVELPDNSRGRISLEPGGYWDEMIQSPWKVAEFAKEKCDAIIRRTRSTDCGPFDQLFPEVIEIERELGTLPLGKLTEELVRRASIQPQPIELGGIKLPIKAITQSGMLFLVVLQIYLWLHIHELRGKIDLVNAPGFDVGWIGTYTSKAARLIFLISLLVPSFAVLVLDYYLSAPLRTRVIFGVIGGVLSVVVALITFVETPIRAKGTASGAYDSPNCPWCN
jgi:hypothetical protein